MTDFQDLIARLEKASGFDQELGARIVCFVRSVRFLSVESRATDLSPATIAIAAEDDLGQRFEFWANDPTASIDAALTLADDKLAIMARGLERLLEKIRSGSWKSGPEVTDGDIARIFAAEALKARAALSNHGEKK